MRKRKKQQINYKSDYRHRQIKINFGDSAYFKQGHQPARREKQQSQKKTVCPLNKLVKLARKIPPIMA